MLKFLLLLFLSPFLFAQSISSVHSKVALDEAFTLKSTGSKKFDNSLFYTHKPLLSCKPKLDAVYKIESTTQLKVLPKGTLQSGSTYSCSYEGESFEFTTKALELLDKHYFKHEKILRLSFNNPIDHTSIQKGITLTRMDNLATTKLQYEILQANEGNLVLKIKENIANYSVKLSINKMLKSQYNTTLATDITSQFNVDSEKISLDKNKRTLTIKDDPRMVSLENGKFALRIFLNDELSSLSPKLIQIKGIENLKIGTYKYLNYHLRDIYKIKDSYYYHDITSDEFTANSTYKVVLKKGLGIYSRELKQDTNYTLRTSNRAKAIIFDDKKPYISSKGELSFSSVNIEDATLIVERVLDDNLRYFMNFSSANMNNVDAFLKEVFNKKLTLNSQQNKLIRQKFKLSDLSNKSLTTGVYKISLHYAENQFNEDGEEKEHVSSKVLFVSDLGISAKLSKTQAFISVLSLSKAQPIANAQVAIYAKNNALLGTAQTNDDGVAIINNKELLSKVPQGIIVKTKDDKNFLRLSQAISSPSPEEILQKPERFKAHIYFQSNILRPASKIHALITIKDRDFISASKLPIKFMLRNPKNKVVHEKVYHTDAYGLIDFEYQLSNSDKLGNYHLDVKIGEHTLAQKMLKVEAFMPPKIENEINTNKEAYTLGELIEANISSAYLFGAPSSNLQGKVTLNARPVNYANKNYKDYVFINRHLEQKNLSTYIDHSEDIVLDSQGKFELVLSTHVKQTVPSMLEAMIGVTIMDDAQPVSNYKKVKLYPYASMVGLKLKHDSFEKGQKLEGKAILIDPLTSKSIQRTLTAVIKRVRWHYNYSSHNYNWEKEVSIVDTFSFNANEDFSRDINDNGDYIIEIHDPLHGHSASYSFDVWWWSYSNISPNNDLKTVEINFKDKLYKKGDKLSVSIKSPILEGQALLSLESDKVHSYKLVPVHKGVAKVTLDIKNDIKRGLHLAVSVYRASDTPSELMPYRAMGYKFVKPNREAHQIKLEMNLPSISKSKRTVHLEVKSDKKAKVLVCVVDRGILQLVKQKTPNIFKHFNEHTPKSVAYYDLYDQLLAYLTEGKLMDFGAGDSLEKKKKHLAPDLGKRIKPFMLWSGLIGTKDGQAKTLLQIPEFNGRASVVVIAINQDSIGVISQDIQIKDDVMIKPSYPKYALDGDKIEVPLRIFNTSKHVKNIDLDAKTSSNLALQLSKKKLSIPSNSSVKITASLYPFQVGKGRITLTAKYDNEEVNNSVELPILSSYALSTKTFKKISNQKMLFTPPKPYSDAAVYITLSNNLIGALRDDLKYLVRYPYGCAEQTSSKLSAMHYSKAFLNNDKLLEKSKHYILEGIKKLDSMQNYYGEFYYWQGGRYVHEYASLYASQALLELKRDNADVKKHLEDAIVKMLKSVATKNGRYDGKYSEANRLYAAFILAEHHELLASTANMLYEKGIYKNSTLSTYYMAAILKLQGKNKKAQQLYTQTKHKLSNYNMNPYTDLGSFGSNVRNMFLYFTIKSQYFDKDANDLQTVKKEFPNLYSTQTKAVALKAMSTYLGKPKNSDIDVTVTINGQSKTYTKPTIISYKQLTSNNIEIEPNKGAIACSVELSKNLPKVLKNEIGQEQLNIQRTFIDAKDKEIDLKNILQGDKFYSKVTLVNYGKINNVVINQRIPACFSIVNNNIKESQVRFKDLNIHLEHKEVRDDRMLHFLNLHKKTEYNAISKKHVNIAQEGVLFTPLIATSVGECKLPAIITESMYDSRINDYAKQNLEVIVKVLKTNKPEKAVHVPLQTVAFKTLAKELVEELYTLEMSSQKATDFLDFYHYPLKKYFRKTDVSKNKILQDRRNYFEEFKKRTYTNIKTSILKSDHNSSSIKISFDYKIDNGKKAQTGTSHHVLKVIKIKGKARISEISLEKKEKEIKKKSTTNSKVPFSGLALALVTDFYTKETSTNNANDFTEFFNYPVTTYFRNTEVSKAKILEDKKSYFKSWKTRTYTNITTTLVENTEQKAKVKISFNYEINNGKKTLTGISKHLLTIINVKGKAFISKVELYK